MFIYVSRPSDKAKFSDNGGSASDDNLVYFIRNDDGTSKQFEYFVPDFSQGLTQVGLSRLNQSIEALVYCVLGARVNTRSSIIDNGGRAKETQSEFLVLLKEAIRSPDISKSIQRYQLAVGEAKARLDFAVVPGCWLMPSRMILNTESTVGYNNKLKQATQGMKLGVNNDVNQGTKKASLRPMHGGPSKINPPNSHPSNPIYKQATQAQGLGDEHPKVNQIKQVNKVTNQNTKQNTKIVNKETSAAPEAHTQTALVDKPHTQKSSIDSHHVNKAIIAVGALVLAGFILWMH